MDSLVVLAFLCEIFLVGSAGFAGADDLAVPVGEGECGVDVSGDRPAAFMNLFVAVPFAHKKSAVEVRFTMIRTPFVTVM